MKEYFKTVGVLVAPFILISAIAAKQAGAETVTEASEVCSEVGTIFMGLKEEALSGTYPWDMILELGERGITSDSANRIVKGVYTSPLSPKELGFNMYLWCMKQYGEAV